MFTPSSGACRRVVRTVLEPSPSVSENAQPPHHHPNTVFQEDLDDVNKGDLGESLELEAGLKQSRVCVASN